MDCGPSCLQAIAKYYGRSYSLQFLRTRAFLTREGVSMLGISEAAEHIGFRTKGYRLSWEDFRDDAPLPCIVHWKQRHFVVVYDIKKKKRFSALPGFKKQKDSEELVYISDPALGLLTYTKDEFLKGWISTKSEGNKEGAVL